MYVDLQQFAAVLLPLHSTVFHPDGNFQGKPWKIAEHRTLKRDSSPPYLTRTPSIGIDNARGRTMPVGVTGCTNFIFEIILHRNPEASFRLRWRRHFCQRFDCSGCSLASSRRANYGKKDFQPVVAAFKALLACFRCDACES